MTTSAPRFPTIAYRAAGARAGTRAVPEETPVALTYNRSGFAVMMASPADLEDFALGFSVSEGIIERPDEIAALAILESEFGMECRIDLSTDRAREVDARRRRLAGPVGCGLCGIESLREAARPLPVVPSGMAIDAATIAHGFSLLETAQTLNQQTRGVHGAGVFDTVSATLVAREDVGRHNALDKAIGAALRAEFAPAACVLFVTSRVSIELIQKAAMFGAPILAAISVPTARAIRAAEEAGIALVAVARGDGFEVFTHNERIDSGNVRDVA